MKIVKRIVKSIISYIRMIIEEENRIMDNYFAQFV